MVWIFVVPTKLSGGGHSPPMKGSNFIVVVVVMVWDIRICRERSFCRSANIPVNII